MFSFLLKNKLALASSVAFFALGIYLGRTLIPPSSKIISQLIADKELRLGGYTFINPLLECDINQSIGQQEYGPSQNEIEKYIDVKKQQGQATDVAVYYRNLNNGPWFGINEHDSFAPASLLKVPVMMAYYKAAETDPTLLQKKLVYTKNPNIADQYFKPQQTLLEGHTYTVEELIEAMITQSDNDATLILEENIPNENIDAITKDLGIETMTDSTPDNYMSVKGYASLYRVLYNASYLSPAYSEKALSILSQTTFPEGISKAIPQSIKVADKFGERELADGTKQLHDCGIIYYPNDPYLICVMTKGNDYQSLGTIIEDISRMIYTNISQRKN